MSATGKKAAELVKAGFCFVCASCPSLQEPHDRGEEGCGRQDCDPPAFPKYAGPVSKDFWRDVCWMCGQTSTIGLHFVGSGTILGACSHHRDHHKAFLGESESKGVIEITDRFSNAI